VIFSFFKNTRTKSHTNHPQFWVDYEALFSKDQNIDSQSKFIVLDTETTGFDYENDRILCIGAVILEKGHIAVKKSFEVYLIQEHYNSDSTPIHGILKEEKKDKATEIEALKNFLSYIGNAPIIAHHTMFDVNMINKALDRNGLPPLKNKLLDTVVLYKKSLLRSPLIERKDHYSLDELADKFNISKKDRHTALGDAYITALLFLKILKKLKEKTGQVSFKRLFIH
jgi:DNA polymerase-3 subunit epsilon